MLGKGDFLPGFAVCSHQGAGAETHPRPCPRNLPFPPPLGLSGFTSNLGFGQADSRMRQRCVRYGLIAGLQEVVSGNETRNGD